MSASETLAAGDHAEESAGEALADAGQVVATEFETAAGGDGGGIAGQAGGCGLLGGGVLFVLVDLLLVVRLLGGGELGFGVFIGGGGLRALKLLDPGQGIVERVVSFEVVEGGHFGGSVGLGEALGQVVLGFGVFGEEPGFAGRVGAAVVAVQLDALNVSLQIFDDGDLAGEGVGGVGAFDFGLDARDGGEVGGVVGAGGLGERGGAGEGEESYEEEADERF